MPNDYATIVGAPPSPDTVAFLRWCRELREARVQHCDFTRSSATANIRYLKAGGGGSNSGADDANAFATLAQAQTYLSGLTAGTLDAGVTLRIKRGDTIRLTTGLDIVYDKLKIETYGDFALPKPIISFGTVLINAANANWVEVNNGTDAKNAWYMPWASVDANPGGYSAPGWIWERANWQNPFCAVTSITECEDTPRSFFWNSGNSRLYVNPGYYLEAWRANNLVTATKINPGSMAFDATGDTGSNTFDRAFEVAVNGTSGYDRVHLKGIVCLGWGCSALNYSSASGITIASGGDCVTLVEECEDYYAGRHALSQEVGGTTTGGRAVFLRNKVGYVNQAKNDAATWNCYAFAGQEWLSWDNEIAFGPLPDKFPLVNSKALNFAHGECLPFPSLGAHCSGGSNLMGLYLNVGLKVTDNRSKYPYATAAYFGAAFSSGENEQGVATDPLSWRTYFVDLDWHDSEPSRATNLPETNLVSISFGKKHWFINPRLTFWKKWTTGSALFTSTNPVCVLLNPQITLIDTTAGDGNFSSGTGASGPAAENNYRMTILGGVIVSKAQAATGIRTRIFGQAGGNGRLANTALVAYGRPICLRGNDFSGGVGAQNSAVNISNIAAHGCLDADSGTDEGFNNAPGFIDLDTHPRGRPIGIDDEIGERPASYQAGSARPFADLAFGSPAYDFKGKPRLKTPSIGAFDAIANSNVDSATGLVVLDVPDRFQVRGVILDHYPPE